MNGLYRGKMKHFNGWITGNLIHDKIENKYYIAFDKGVPLSHQRATAYSNHYLLKMYEVIPETVEEVKRNDNVKK